MRANQRRRIKNPFKVLLLFLIAILLHTPQNAFSQGIGVVVSGPHNASVTKIINLGETITIYPKSDMDIGSNYGNSGSNMEYDKSGIAVTPETIGSGYKYAIYHVTGLKCGTYTFSAWMFGGNPVSYVATYTFIVVDVTSITLPSATSVTIGDTYTFSPLVIDERASYTLSWSSSNPNIATISNDGTAQAISCGSTVITCTANNGVSAQCTLIVNPILVNEITIDQTEISIPVNSKRQLSADVLPENATNRNIKWSTSNESIAIVSSTGLVTAISCGYANIIATSCDGSEVSVSCLVRVVEPPTSMNIECDEPEIYEGDDATLTAHFLPDDVLEDISWSSSNESVATIDQNGQLSAISSGHTIITATSVNGLTATYNVEVLQPQIFLSQDFVKSYIGWTVKVQVTILAGKNFDRKLTVSSSDYNAASPYIKDDYLAFYSEDTGEAQITITASNGMMAVCNVVVDEYQPQSINYGGFLARTADGINQKSFYLGLDRLYPAPYDFYDKEIEYDVSENLIAVSEDSTIVEISISGSSSYGFYINYIGRGYGNTYIDIISPAGLVGKLSVSSDKNPDKIYSSSIEIAEESLTLTPGDTYQLLATVLPEDADDKGIIWYSSDEDVVTVSQDGTITAVGLGEATIKARSHNNSFVFKNIPVTVKKAVYNYFDIANTDVVPGQMLRLPVVLKNRDAITAFQCDVEVSGGLEIGDFVLSNRRTNHTITSQLQSDGSMRAVALSMTKAAFKDNDGALFYVPIKIPDTPNTEYTVRIKGVKLTGTDQTPYECEDITATISVGEGVVGDSNSNGVVDINDVVSTVAYILDNNTKINIKTADVNHDNVIDINDVVGTISIILNQ